MCCLLSVGLLWQTRSGSLRFLFKSRVSWIESLKFESNQYQIAWCLNRIAQCLNRIYIAIRLNRIAIDLILPITGVFAELRNTWIDRPLGSDSVNRLPTVILYVYVSCYIASPSWWQQSHRQWFESQLAGFFFWQLSRIFFPRLSCNFYSVDCWLTVSGFDLAWFSSVFQAPLCLWS